MFGFQDKDGSEIKLMQKSYSSDVNLTISGFESTNRTL
jgi:hypothetical protein